MDVTLLGKGLGWSIKLSIALPPYLSPQGGNVAVRVLGVEVSLDNRMVVILTLCGKWYLSYFHYRVCVILVIYDKLGISPYHDW